MVFGVMAQETVLEMGGNTETECAGMHNAPGVRRYSFLQIGYNIHLERSIVSFIRRYDDAGLSDVIARTHPSEYPCVYSGTYHLAFARDTMLCLLCIPVSIPIHMSHRNLFSSTFSLATPLHPRLTSSPPVSVSSLRLPPSPHPHHPPHESPPTSSSDPT